MILFRKYFQSYIRYWAASTVIAICFLTTSCESSKQEQTNGSNVGAPQDEMEIDTTASAGRGGTDQATGRANTDTSGTGRINDTIR